MHFLFSTNIWGALKLQKIKLKECADISGWWGKANSIGR